jgi:hypothetical protein
MTDQELREIQRDKRAAAIESEISQLTVRIADLAKQLGMRITALESQLTARIDVLEKKTAAPQAKK